MSLLRLKERENITEQKGLKRTGFKETMTIDVTFRFLKIAVNIEPDGKGEKRNAQINGVEAPKEKAHQNNYNGNIYREATL